MAFSPFSEELLATSSKDRADSTIKIWRCDYEYGLRDSLRSDDAKASMKGHSGNIL
jgi:hypothetical protein